MLFPCRAALCVLPATARLTRPDARSCGGSRFAGLGLGLLLRGRWRHGVLEARPLGVAVIVGREVLGCRDRITAFGEIAYVEQDRHQIDISEGELVAGKVTRLRDGLVQNVDLLVQLR